jgi:hypothetical protein
MEDQTSVSPTAAIPVIHSASIQNNSKSSTGKVLILILIFIFLLIIAALVVIILIVNNNNNSKNTNKKSCSYNGVTYAHGSSFRSSDGCNTCNCSDGAIVCTEMYCLTTPTPTLNPTVTPVEKEVSIFFGKPSGVTDLTTLDSVTRSGTAEDPYSFALDDLIAGPTNTEKGDGYTSTFTLSGTSNCSGSDYVLTKSKNVITVKFCKNIDWTSNPGTEEGDSWAGMSLSGMFRVTSSIEKTLKFDGVTSVVIRDKDNNCYALDAGGNQDCE